MSRRRILGPRTIAAWESMITAIMPPPPAQGIVSAK